MHELFTKRVSGRSLDPSATIDMAELIDMLDAARWAPTWANTQSVRFIVGVRGDETFTELNNALTRGNAWATASSALILLTTRTNPDDEVATTYGAVDVGLATAQLVLQAVAHGYNAHPMAGYDTAAVIEHFSIPAGERPLVMVSIGTAVHEDNPRERKRLPMETVAFSRSWGHPFAP